MRLARVLRDDLGAAHAPARALAAGALATAARSSPAVRESISHVVPYQALLSAARATPAGDSRSRAAAAAAALRVLAADLAFCAAPVGGAGDELEQLAAAFLADADPVVAGVGAFRAASLAANPRRRRGLAAAGAVSGLAAAVADADGAPFSRAHALHALLNLTAGGDAVICAAVCEAALAPLLAVEKRGDERETAYARCILANLAANAQVRSRLFTERLSRGSAALRRARARTATPATATTPRDDEGLAAADVDDAATLRRFMRSDRGGVRRRRRARAAAPPPLPSAPGPDEATLRAVRRQLRGPAAGLWETTRPKTAPARPVLAALATGSPLRSSSRRGPPRGDGSRRDAAGDDQSRNQASAWLMPTEHVRTATQATTAGRPS